MTSFDDARAIAEKALRDDWYVGGTFHVAEYGWESPALWCLAVGAREWLVDLDDRFQVDTDLLVLVDKKTGKLTTPPAHENLDLLRTMTPLGFVPAEFL